MTANRTHASTTTMLEQLGGVDSAILPLWQKTLIDKGIHNLQSHYLFPYKIKEDELRSEMTAEFRKRFSKPGYEQEEGIADKAQFAKEVTEIIKNIIHDDHIYLSFNSKMISENKTAIESTGKFPWDRGLNEPKITSEEERRQREEDFIRDGCGFHEARGIDAVAGRIPPNVGYMGLDYVADAETFSIVKEKAFDAMLKVKDKDAIIIDLRNNRGGSPEGMLYLLSFFFKEKTPINTYEKTENGAKEEKNSRPWRKIN